MRHLALLALLLAPVLGSTGTTLSPSPAATDSPANQGQASSPPQSAFALGPVAVPTAPTTPSASPSPEKAAAVSPAAPTEPRIAPAPVAPPKEYSAPPPVEVAPTDPTDEVPPPVAPPQAAVGNPTPILPGTPALLPYVQAPAPSVVLKPNPPVVVSPPPANNQPSRPVGSVPPYPPPASPPPANGIPPYPPSGRFPAIPPATSAVPPPATSPVIAQAPQRRADPPSRDYKNGNAVPPANTYPPTNLKKHHVPHASPPKGSTGQTVPGHKSPVTGSAPATSPLPQNTNMPSIPKNASSVPHAHPSPPSIAPELAPTGHPSFPVHSPSPSPASSRGPANAKKRNHISPTLPSIPPLPEPKAPSAHPIWTLPPPPPNSDCNSLSCPEPLTDPPAGAPCACVLPIRVGIRLSVDLYSFFPLVSDFAEEVASGVNMAQRQVRVMGANVAGDQPDKTMVLVDLVPVQVKFDNATAFSAFESLWSKKVSLKPSVFGNYEILYVVYPGLPPSPPSGQGVGDGAFGNNRNARAVKPLGVDVRSPKRKVNGSLIAIVVLSTVIALIICCLAAWSLILRFRGPSHTARGFPHTALPKFSSYVAPEYAMTGHLLVKSDVYSYGVVLLELLTGRKPVDMSRPAGQENLVAWARPLLTNVLSLRQAVDPLLGPNVPLDNVAKAAAIASMCVQPEVAHRPSMGEVVQALKLVCSEGDDGIASGRFSQELPMQTTAVYDATGMEAERVLISDIFGSTPLFTRGADSDSFRKQSSSGPLMTGKNRKFWQRLRSLSRGSMSEHGISPDYETRSQYSGR
ncbi:Protein kinase superfamily protein [Zea mays]|uniref:Protein kinase superfamily protein n=1 Tax=Zea mays TaxID=4577 RepID=A0A1D6MHI8_MAIZE|nr:Protein kinase superfamily protein [Zea mays]